ncbi:MAG: hypothetical protein V5B31_07215 [Candidatus Accumulibacter propinquus]|jgi:transposase|uniref:hypothetical protein n=1 Tax=Candidatus Accumulibacter propinquus TaxID=2954380 RepID=UPI002FC39ACD
MHLRKHDLLQMDDEWLKKLQAELFLEVSKRLLHDVKELQDRLNQSPTNSSRPPTSRAPWEKPRDAAGEASDARVENPPESAAEPATDAADSTAEPVKANVTPSSSPKGSSKPRGKQPCCPGHGRTQKLAITDTCEYRPDVARRVAKRWRRTPGHKSIPLGMKLTLQRRLKVGSD